MSRVSGHPPRQVRYAMSCKLYSHFPAMLSGVLNSSAKLTIPLESPDSHRLMGRMTIRPMRPVPECRICCSPSKPSRTTTEPVRMKCPCPWRWSTSYRTASHNTGATCHSSMSRGVGPSRIRCGSMLASRMCWSLVAVSPI